MYKPTTKTNLSNRQRAARAVLHQFAAGGVFTFRHDGVYIGKPGASFATRVKSGLWRWLDVMAYVRLNRDTGQYVLMPQGARALEEWRAHSAPESAAA